jgi:putative CocE/NonD family hydrolase
MLEDFATLRSSGGERARASHRIVVGPWTHHLVGSYAVDRGAAESPESVRWLRAEIARWFDRWLRDVSSPASAPISYWMLGDEAWKTTTSWPPPGGATKALYLGLRGALLPKEPPPPGGFDAFAHDPADPVPTVGGANLDPALASGSQDQRGRVVGRGDVLVYRSDPLTAPLSIAGRVTAALRVSCDAADARLHVRLCDEHPDGRVMLLCDGARAISMRGRFASAEPVEPGTEYDVSVVLPDLAATFAAGHRVLVAISGSNAPRFEPQPFAVVVKVARGGDHGSRVLLPLAP